MWCGQGKEQLQVVGIAGGGRGFGGTVEDTKTANLLEESQGMVGKHSASMFCYALILLYFGGLVYLLCYELS